MFWHMLLWQRFGQVVYVIGPRSQDLLSRVGLAKVTPEMLKPPHTSIYLALSQCPWKLWGGERTGWHLLEGMYASHVPLFNPSTQDVDECIQFFLIGMPNAKSLEASDDAHFHWQLNLSEWRRKAVDLESYVGEIANRAANEVFCNDPLSNDPVGRQPAGPVQRNTVLNGLRLLLNLMIYVASKGAEVSEELSEAQRAEAQRELARQIARTSKPKKRRVLSARLERLQKSHRIVYVGAPFEEAGRSAAGREPGGHADTDQTRGCHATPVEHLVGLHWHSYLVGPKSNPTREWKLIHPYRRGVGQRRTLFKMREPR